MINLFGDGQNEPGTSYIEVNGNLRADGGKNAAGGFISIAASGAGYDITVGSTSLLSAQGGTESGSGGQVFISSASAITLDAAVNASARGTGDGGTIAIESFSELGSKIHIHKDLRADGSGTGLGGSVSITGYGGNSKVSLSPASTGIFARGGDAEGSGGSLLLHSEGNLNLEGNKLDASARGIGDGGRIEVFGNSTEMTISGNYAADGGTIGKGGSIEIRNTLGNLTIGDSQSAKSSITANGGIQEGDGNFILVSSVGFLTVNQRIRADGISKSGSGGTISLSASSSDPIRINGNIWADALGEGTSGHIIFENKLPSSMLAVNISGQISADSASGKAASNEFKVSTISPQSLEVKVTGNGKIAGPIRTEGSASNVTLTWDSNSASLLEVGALEAKGDIQISIKEPRSAIRILSTGRISSGGAVLIESPTIDNNGQISGFGVLLQEVANFQNTGSVSAKTFVAINGAKNSNVTVGGSGSIRAADGHIEIASGEGSGTLTLSDSPSFSATKGTFLGTNLGGEKPWEQVTVESGTTMSNQIGELNIDANFLVVESNARIQSPTVLLRSSDTDLALTPAIQNDGVIEAISGVLSIRAFSEISLTGLTASGVYISPTNAIISQTDGASQLNDFYVVGTVRFNAPLLEIKSQSNTVANKNSSLATTGNLRMETGFIENDGIIRAGSSGTFTAVDPNGNDIVVLGTGTLEAKQITVRSPMSSVAISQSRIDGLLSIQSGSGGIAVTTTKGDLLLGEIIAVNGSMEFVANKTVAISGTSEAPGTLRALSGEILIQTSKSNGNIYLGPHADISAQEVRVVVGKDVSLDGNSTIPGITVVVSGAGDYNNAGSIVTSGTNNSINLTNGSVTLNAGSGSIYFRGEVAVNASILLPTPFLTSTSIPGENAPTSLPGPFVPQIGTQPLSNIPTRTAGFLKEQQLGGTIQESRAAKPQVSTGWKEEFRPVSFLSIVSPLPVPLSRFTDSRASWWSSFSSVFQSTQTREAYRIIGPGETLVFATKPIKIYTDQGVLFLSSGSIVLIEGQANYLRVLNLHDRHRSSVYCQIDSGSIGLEPGQELRIGGASFNKRVARRRVQSFPFSKTVVLSDFSLASAFKDNSLLLHMRLAEEPHSRRVISSIMKTGACLNLTTGGRGRFDE